jgi:rod shape-determining protein MreC
VPFKRLDQTRPFLTLGIAVAVWLVVPVAIKAFLRASFFELQAPVKITASYTQDLQEYWALRIHSNHELIEAGRDAARVAASYAFATQQTANLQAQVARLENLLKLPSYAGYRPEHARVVQRDLSAWWQQLVIRKGKNFGITVGAPVIFSGGVVGRITEVHATTSVVELISSPGVRLSAFIEGDDRAIVFEGGINPTFGPSRGIVEFVPLNVFANKPLRLITSGLGGVFPEGLSLGEITRLEISADGLFKNGDVKLDERLASLLEVTVLVPLKAD